MANLIGNKSGAIVLETNKGLLQIYIKDGKSIVTLESSRNLVTYAKSFDINGVISPFTSIVSRMLPNSLALKVIGHEFGKRENIILEDNNSALTLHNEGIKKGNKVVDFTTYSNIKVDNLFDEFDRNPNVFSGFCNYKIDSLGNIEDVEKDLLSRSFTPSTSIEKLMENEKAHEALMKESACEKYLSRIYKDYAKEHDDELDDIQRIGFKKIKNLYSEVNDALSSGKKDDMIDTIERAKTTIVARNSSIPNIMEYIDDSRIEGNYDVLDINRALGMLYVMEKLKLYGKTADVEDKFKGYEVDPKLMMILSEDIARSYKKEERINFEEMLPIQFVRTREKIMDIPDMEMTKVDGVLKRYVDLLESMDYTGEGPTREDDELGIIIRNYENYLEEGVLSSLGIPEGDGFITMFRNAIKTEVIKQKVKCDDVITFSYTEENDSEIEGTGTRHEYNYLVCGDSIRIFRDNQDCGIIDEKEMKDKYATYVDEGEAKKQSISRLANKTHFIFLPGEDGITSIEPEYRQENIVNDTIYMIKTVEQEKDIPRKAYLKDISQNLGDNSAAARSVDMEEVIYSTEPKDVLRVIQEELAGDEEEVLSEQDLEEIADLMDETGALLEPAAIDEPSLIQEPDMEQEEDLVE